MACSVCVDCDKCSQKRLYMMNEKELFNHFVGIKSRVVVNKTKKENSFVKSQQELEKVIYERRKNRVLIKVEAYLQQEKEKKDKQEKEIDTKPASKNIYGQRDKNIEYFVNDFFNKKTGK